VSHGGKPDRLRRRLGRGFAAGFSEPEAAEDALNRLSVRFSALDADAGGAWAAYRRRGGSRARLIPDFLVGAHAFTQAEALLTRDRGFYRQCFPRLRLVDPTAAD